MARCCRLVALALVVLMVGRSLAAAQAPASRALARDESRDRNLRAYVELLRSDIRTQKVAVLTELLQLSDGDDKVFWPIYREYDVELNAINDDRLSLVETYAASYGKLTPNTASDLVGKALTLEARRTALKQKYFARLKSALSPLTAARILQIEHQIQLLVDLQIAASLPVIP